jgi:LuxR family quorum sensing-dependent transcriptional regulator
VADGKTAWEVSRILSISEHTVLTHQRNVKQKLDAANNVHAVVKAFLRQEIQP